MLIGICIYLLLVVAYLVWRALGWTLGLALVIIGLLVYMFWFGYRSREPTPTIHVGTPGHQRTGGLGVGYSYNTVDPKKIQLRKRAKG